MDHTETRKPNIGNEIPYRRSQMEKRTGSMVFDRHLDQTIADAPPQSGSQAKVGEQNPLKRGQVT